MTIKEAMRKIGKESLANSIRREIIGHSKKYDLPIDEAEDVIMTIAREIDTYGEDQKEAA